MTSFYHWRSATARSLRLSCAPARRYLAVVCRGDVEVIREAFERWNRRDIDHWISHAHPEVEVWSKYAALDEGASPIEATRASGSGGRRSTETTSMRFYSSHAEAVEAAETDR
jgi:ketosteroid isomerase-like protein